MVSDKVITVTHTDYVTVYEEPIMTLHDRQNDGTLTPSNPTLSDTPTQTSSSTHSGGPNPAIKLWIILGGAVGGLALLFILLCAMQCIRRSKKEKKAINSGNQDLEAGK